MVEARAEERIIVLRLASWDSSHDSRAFGLKLDSDDELIAFVRELERYARVLITSERVLPAALERSVIRLPLNRVHDLLSVATLYIGEGATMASEAGVLGTPWIFVSSEGRGYLNDQQERYGLGYRTTSPDATLARATELLEQKDLKATWKTKRDRLLREKIDVTQYIVDFLEHWATNAEPAVSTAPGRG